MSVLIKWFGKIKSVFFVIGISVLSVFALAFLIWDIVVGFNFGAKTTNVKNLELKWSIQEFKNYQSGPFFNKKVVFFVDNQNNLIALNRETGKELWERDLKQLSGGEILGQPVFFADKIYVATWDSKSEKVGMILNCLNIDDLSIKWQKSLGGTFKEFLFNDKYLVVKTDEYVIPTGCEECDEKMLKKFYEDVEKTRSGEYAFFVIDKDTGEIVRKINNKNSRELVLDGDFLFYLIGDGYASSGLGAVDLSIGEEVWRQKYDNVFEYVPEGDMLVGLISEDGNIFFIAWDKSTGEERWRFLSKENVSEENLATMSGRRDYFKINNGWIEWENTIIDSHDGKLIAAVNTGMGEGTRRGYLLLAAYKPFLYYFYDDYSSIYRLDLEHKCGLDTMLFLKDVKSDCEDGEKLVDWSIGAFKRVEILDNFVYMFCKGNDLDEAPLCVFDLNKGTKVAQSDFEMSYRDFQIVGADGGVVAKDYNENNFYYFELAK